MGLNKSQKEAVDHFTGPLLLLASAGSGKTSVIVNRVKNLINKYGVSEKEILVVTFTKAAAGEMSERFIFGSDNSGSACLSEVTFATFHSFFFSVLSKEKGLRPSDIVGKERKYEIIAKSVPKEKRSKEEYKDLIKRISNEISVFKNRVLPPVEEEDLLNFNSEYLVNGSFARVYRDYTEGLLKEGLYDLDDLVLTCYELFKNSKEILDKYSDMYKYILIDEFQDINLLQYEIVKMLAKKRGNIFAVGDIDQSIYGFRGSRPEILLNFKSDFKGARIQSLDMNYRCPPNIWNFSEKIIRDNKNRYKRKTDTYKKENGILEILSFDESKDELEFLVGSLRKFIKEGVKPSDMAVLFRTNALADFLCNSFIKYNIPFCLRDKIPNLYETEVAKDIFSFIRLARGVGDRGDVLRIVNKPNRYVSRKVLGMISEDGNISDLLWFYQNDACMKMRLERLFTGLNYAGTLNPYACITYIRKALGYENYLIQYAKENSVEPDEYIDILDKIHEASYGFLNYPSFARYIKEYKNKISDSLYTDGVNLLTFHAAKGLEFDKVFVYAAYDGMIPYVSNIRETDFEEERRLLYVALTRSKESLYITYPKVRKGIHRKISRFIT